MAQYIEQADCIACGECQRRCPTGAIAAGTNWFTIQPEKCIDCRICAETCPEGAVHDGAEVWPAPKPRRVYRVIAEKCIGCSLCARVCPAKAITGEIKKPYTVDPDKCVGCGLCAEKCRKDALERVGEPKAERPYVIDPAVCVSCGLCASHCPAGVIHGEEPPYNYELRDVVRTPFATAELDMLYLQKEHILAVGQARFFGGNRGAEITLGELAAAPLIIYRRWQRVIEAAFETAGYPIDPYCVNDDASMTLQLALQGMGVGLLHPSALPGKLDEAIVLRRLSEETLASHIVLVCQKAGQLPRPAQLFWKLLEDAKNRHFFTDS